MHSQLSAAAATSDRSCCKEQNTSRELHRNKKDGERLNWYLCGLREFRRHMQRSVPFPNALSVLVQFSVGGVDAPFTWGSLGEVYIHLSTMTTNRTYHIQFDGIEFMNCPTTFTLNLSGSNDVDDQSNSIFSFCLHTLHLNHSSNTVRRHMHDRKVISYLQNPSACMPSYSSLMPWDLAIAGVLRPCFVRPGVRPAMVNPYYENRGNTCHDYHFDLQVG